ncbi:Tn3 family transposase [Arthrobacter sp. CG_A4]|uniref:Tn3 family transposase n=1 Tax=Arthrobacter sp. CG_A4 TaxID=3071706 RepID=UPI002E115119
MPVEFLTDVQAAAYSRFTQPPSLAELERFFFLDDTDMALVNKRRGDYNRLGFSLQLGTARLLGSFLADPLDVPTEAVDFLAEQLGVADPSCLKAYGEREKTRLEHQWEIAREFGYRDFPAVEAELVRWVDDRAWNTGDGPKALFEGAVVWLRERRVLLPGVTILARLIARVRDEAMQRLWDVMASMLTTEQARLVERLLEVPEGARVSDLERLRKAPRPPSGRNMVKSLDRVAEVAGLGVGALGLDTVPHRRVVELARWGMSGTATALRRHRRSRKLATMLATVVYLEAKATDDTLEMFDVLMTTDLLARAERESKTEKLRRYPRLSKDAAKCAAAVEVMLASTEWGEEITIELLWDAIESVVSRAELRTAVTNLTDVIPPPDADPNGDWRATLVTRFAAVRGFLPLLTEVVAFGATAESTPVLDAMRALPGLLPAKASKRVPTGFLDARLVAVDLVPAGWWRPLVFRPGRPEGTVDRAGYVFCVLEQFHRHLKRRDIYAAASTRWADPRAQLLTGAAWDAACGPVLNDLQLPADPAELLASRAGDLDAAWRHVAAGLDGDAGVRIDDEGRLHVKKDPAITDPPSLTDLRKRCEAMMPQADVGEQILEVMTWEPDFFKAFTAASGGQTRLDDLHVTIAAALTAQALNVGFTPVISGAQALTRSRISHVDQNYLRAESYAAANAPLITGQAEVALAQTWGGGLVAAVDGIRFVVPIRSVDARPNPKYFGRGRGVTWLNMVNDQSVGLAGRVVSGTPKDTLHLVDLIYSQDGGRRPDVIITDSGSYSDIIFGLLQLLGFDYRPQLADLPDAKLWRTDPDTDYGPLNSAARGRIDLTRIDRHWPEILRVVASIHTGAVSAYDVIRMLQRDGRPTPLGDAFAHYGRIFKTLHVLRVVQDEPYRREIKGMRNLQEGRHDLGRHLFHGRKGELRHGYREGMEDQLGALGLVLNCITLWNTVYLDRVLDALRATGYPVLDADVARLSPYMRKHINVHGHYSFLLPELLDGRRPLRDPDAATAEED